MARPASSASIVNVHHKADLIEAHLEGRRRPADRDFRRARQTAGYGRRREKGPSTARDWPLLDSQCRLGVDRGRGLEPGPPDADLGRCSHGLPDDAGAGLAQSRLSGPRRLRLRGGRPHSPAPRRAGDRAVRVHWRFDCASAPVCRKSGRRIFAQRRVEHGDRQKGGHTACAWKAFGCTSAAPTRWRRPSNNSHVRFLARKRAEPALSERASRVRGGRRTAVLARACRGVGGRQACRCLADRGPILCSWPTRPCICRRDGRRARCRRRSSRSRAAARCCCRRSRRSRKAATISS